jgi:hypothetical protein
MIEPHINLKIGLAQNRMTTCFKMLPGRTKLWPFFLVLPEKSRRNKSKRRKIISTKIEKTIFPYDVKKQSIWFLSPQVGLTEFNVKGEALQKINFPRASHQVQITPEDTWVIPYSWDTKEDAQVSEIDINGKVLFQWRGKDFVEKSAHANSVAPTQPRSYTATTSAVKTSAGNYYLSMAQKDLIIKINKDGEVLWQQEVSTRPHTLVVKGDTLVGYSARSPNRLILMNDDCHCFKEVVIDELIGGKMSTRSLSLQYLGKGLWFTSGVSALYILNDEGKIYWKLEHDGLRGRPIGFHAAVLFGN